MESVLTLVAAGGHDAAAAAGGLDAATAEQVRRALGGLGAEPGAADWLAASVACDVPFDGIHPDQAEAAARQALGARPVDVVAQPAEGRRKALLVADMESTLIHQEMLDELADALDLRPRIAAITARAMNGEIEFRAALAERVALLAGLPEATLEQAWQRVTYTQGAASLAATMRAAGAHCVIVSGGFTWFTARVRQQLGFHEDHGNLLEIENGRLTGRALEPVRDKDDKLNVLVATAGRLGIPMAATMAVGDGANDLPMLQAAGLGVAFHAKPAVRAAARTRIDHADLGALLYAQGYRRDEIVAAVI